MCSARQVGRVAEGRNRLGEATSPYLLQHAANPVHWWPWCDEAFAEAARREVPVLLSIGYAACHWCHVMAHESFEDEPTATLLNEGFVAVKVDREERPDVDAVYMAATQALSGQGGWPMTVFLTPEGHPFYAGTYFPPTPLHGLPSFGQLLEAVSEAWAGRRADVVQSATEIAGRLSARMSRSDSGDASPPGAHEARLAIDALAGEFDAQHGGFGRAPKFPPSMVVEALLRDGSERAMAMAGSTLEAMARGGIYDQLAGGFARYSVDMGWVVPHFEKMLYDNALLLGVYTHWWRRTQNPLAARVVADTVAWLEREMRTAEGAFAASLDADSADELGRHREGAYYVWTLAELEKVLGQDAEWASETFGVTPGGTFEAGASTLRLIGDPEPSRLAAVRQRLLAARARRSPPGRDDKVVAAWNGWLCDALAEAGSVFGRPDWVAMAAEAAEHVWQLHWHGGRLRRTSRGQVAGAAAGILEDYGGLALGCLRLAAAEADRRWLLRAETLLSVVLEQFDDGRGGFFDTAADAERLYARPQDPTDNATPSGLSTVLQALAGLSRLTSDPRWQNRADRAAATVGELVARAPRFAGWQLAAAVSRDSRRSPVEVAVVGPAGADRDQLAACAVREAPAGSVVLAGEPDQPGFPLLADRPLIDGKPTAYVCRDFVCRLPVTTVSALRGHLVTLRG